MRAPLKLPKMTVEEYLAFEEKSKFKHEYVDGAVFGMVGASEPHNLISQNFTSAFRQRLRGSNCTAFMSEMKVRVLATNSYYYPDVMVSCESVRERKAEWWSYA